ncbi:MAG: hypothetical protein L0228_16765, partial [Planctomycetes bacterium]|nr:hypothetical protein [Planctomycetota bacterium]
MLMEQASGSRSLRAPQADGQKLIEPPLDALPQVVADSRERLAHVDYDVQGRSLAELSSSARRTLVEKAAAYTSQYRDVSARFRPIQSLTRAPFILAGHQPQLFHPGVWYKNFVLGSLARQLDAVPVHLLIDSDLCRSASIRVPTGSVEEPHVEVVPYDEPSAEVPYEERAIRDFGTLRSFADRAAALIRPFVPDPLITSLWPLVLDRNPQQSNLGLRLAQGRHALEESWHNDTLELPQSVVCQLPEFAWFVAHVLAHLPRFWSAYNDALAAYRHAHHLRNRAHPVPDLAETDGWLESPFWIWSADVPRRRPLFAQQAGDELVITDRDSRTFRLALSGDRDAAAAADQLLHLASRGVKIRTRALTTTLFARVVLSDLFLHGIGGAKYDQVTDQITRAFFGFEPPEFAAVSATLRLPIAGNRVDAAHDRSCAEQLRELRFHQREYPLLEPDRVGHLVTG